MSVLTWTDKLFVPLHSKCKRLKPAESKISARTLQEILFIGDRCVFYPQNWTHWLSTEQSYFTMKEFSDPGCSIGAVYKRGTESYRHSGGINLGHALDLRTSHSPPNKYICSAVCFEQPSKYICSGPTNTFEVACCLFFVQAKITVWVRVEL